MEDLIAAYDVDIGQQALYNLIRNNLSFLRDDVYFTLVLAAAHALPVILVDLFHRFVTGVLLRPETVEKYRWQPNKHPSPELVKKCYWYVLKFHLFMIGLTFFLADGAFRRDPGVLDGPVPGILTMLQQFFVAYLCTDILFYWIHRLLHTSYFYQRIHKQHHQFYVTIGIAAQYAHPIELALGNVMPVMFASVVFKYHLFVMASWLGIAMLATTIHHSGFTMPLAPTDGFHDFHHSHVVCNFGNSVVWDWLFGTDKQYRAFLLKQKNGQNKNK